MKERTEIKDFPAWYRGETITYNDLLVVKDLNFTDDLVTIERGTNRIHFHNCRFKKVHVLSGREVKFLDDCESDEIHLTNGQSIESFQYFRSTINFKLYIVASDFEITLDNSIIKELHLFPNFGKFKSFSANLCTFERVIFERFSAHLSETVRFDLCIIKREMSIQYSIIDNVGFNGLNLKDASLHILNSTLLKANYYSITWPKTFMVSERLINYNEPQNGKTVGEKKLLKDVDEDDIDKLMEIYRQLKVISINSYNKVVARKFQRNELRMFHKKIKLQQIKKDKSSSAFERNGDLLILWLNKVVSNYGESLWRPIIILMIFGQIFFWIVMGKLGVAIQFNINKIDTDVTCQAVGYYFNFLNPVHSDTVQDIVGRDIQLFSFWDFLIRLFSGYLIYHIIRATRKFSFSI